MQYTENNNNIVHFILIFSIFMSADVRNFAVLNNIGGHGCLTYK